MANKQEFCGMPAMALALLLGFVSCATNADKYAKPAFVKAAEKECKSKGYLFASASYKIDGGNTALAKSMATQAARAELSRQLGSMTRALVENVLDVKGNAGFDISQTVSQADLSGSVIEEDDAIGDHYWVVISFERKRADSIISQAAQKSLKPEQVKELENKLDSAIDKTFR